MKVTLNLKAGKNHSNTSLLKGRSLLSNERRDKSLAISTEINGLNVECTFVCIPERSSGTSTYKLLVKEPYMYKYI